MVGQLVQARGRDEGSKALDEDKRLEDNVRCPITERGAKLVHDAAVGREREALVREWRTGDIAAKMLQSRCLPRLDLHGCVQAESVKLCTQLLDHQRTPGERCFRNA